jgi:hypothetical protein
MRSALYYPHTDIPTETLMKTALLTWDKVHTIIPDKDYKPSYNQNNQMTEASAKAMAKAWELIGEGLVATQEEQKIAHDSIVEMLNTSVPEQIRFLADQDLATQRIYEIWPQKFAAETFRLMEQHSLTRAPLPNGDYPFTHEGGVLIMSKLADAIAGTQFARVTDQSLAFGMTADRIADQAAEQAVVMTLDLVDASQFSLDKLVKFREGNEKGSCELRENYAKAVEAHVAELKTLTTQRQRDDKNRQFKNDMQRDLETLGKAITGNKLQMVLKPVIVTTLVAAGTGLAVAHGGLPTALYVAGTAALGVSATEVADKVAKLVEQGFGYSKKQREAMAKHPMAYMYQLAHA